MPVRYRLRAHPCSSRRIAPSALNASQTTLRLATQVSATSAASLSPPSYPEGRCGARRAFRPVRGGPPRRFLRAQPPNATGGRSTGGRRSAVSGELIDQLRDQARPTGLGGGAESFAGLAVE